VAEINSLLSCLGMGFNLTQVKSLIKLVLKSKIMNNLQKITIQVPEDIAQVYNQASEIEKQEIITRISFFLKPTTTNKQQAIKKLRQTMTEIGNKAITRGLTPEILEDILKEDE
jgi:hypothetical protein